MTSSHRRTAVTMFLGLEPDARFADAVWSSKRRIRELAGPQQFLDHPPHLTLYLAAFDEADAVLAAAEQLAAVLEPTSAHVLGWHTFWADHLTGSHTLVCRLDDTAASELRLLQSRAIEALAPLRNVAATEARYENRLAHLSPIEQVSIAGTGFPYAGEHWHPHVTIASIAAADWPAVEREVVPDAPHLATEFRTLTCFRLVDGHPMPAGSFPLGRTASTSYPTLPLAS